MLISDQKLQNLRNNYTKRNIPIISTNTQKYITNLINTQKPKNIIEIGSCMGYSWMIISKTIHKRDWNIIGFEISFPSYKQYLNNIYNHHITNFKVYNTNFLKTPIERILKKKSFDMAFIDAKKQDYLKYIFKIIPYLHTNSILILDDVVAYKSKMIDLYDRLDKNNISYKIHKLDKNDGIMQINLNQSARKQFNKATQNI